MSERSRTLLSGDDRHQERIVRTGERRIAKKPVPHRHAQSLVAIFGMIVAIAVASIRKYGVGICGRIVDDAGHARPV